MKRFLVAATVLVLVAMLAGGCAGIPPATSTSTEGSATSLPTGKGILEVRITDPPPPMTNVWVEIENVEAHKDGGKWETIAGAAGPFDLKAIEGIEAFLASKVVEAGRYTQLRLDVAAVKVTVNGENITAKVPSEKIKLVGTFEVVDGQATAITLDFNGEKSLVVTGNGKYIFKPVIKLLVSKAPDAFKITTNNLPDGGVGTAYTATLEAELGTLPYTWAKVAGDLPPGLDLSSGGIISGTPTTEGDYDFTVQVTDNSTPPLTDTRDFSISIVSAGTLRITTTTWPQIKLGTAYTSTLEAIGGALPYTWTKIDGDLPPGLDISPTGVISGTPTVEGVYRFTVQVTDNSTPPLSETRNLGFHIKP